jgi:hypothetical protein
LPHGVQIEPLPAAPGAPDAANGARDNGLLR